MVNGMVCVVACATRWVCYYCCVDSAGPQCESCCRKDRAALRARFILVFIYLQNKQLPGLPHFFRGYGGIFRGAKFLELTNSSKVVRSITLLPPFILLGIIPIIKSMSMMINERKQGKSQCGGYGP